MDPTLIFLAFLFTIIIIQVVFIRMKLSKIKTDLVIKQIDAQKDAITSATSESKLRVYAITVELDLTSKLGIAMPESFRESLVSRMTERPMSLPFVCDYGVKSFDVRITKVAFLVIATGAGGEALARDIANNEINYVMVQQEVYKAVYDPSIKDDVIVPYYQGQNMLDTADAYNDSIVITLLSLANNEPLVGSAELEHNVCNFIMQPFMGKIVLKGGQGNVIDTVSQIIGAPGKSLPLHVVGYRAL